MKNDTQTLFQIHDLRFRIWKNTRDPELEKQCHRILHKMLEILPPSHPHVQSVILKNCIILSYRKDFTPIENLLTLFQSSLERKESTFVPLYNRLKMMLG